MNYITYIGIEYLINSLKTRREISRDNGLKIAQDFAQKHACDCGTPTFIEEAEEVILIGTFKGLKFGEIFRAVHGEKHYALIMNCEDSEIIHWKQIGKNQPTYSVSPPVSHSDLISVHQLRKLQGASSNDFSPLKSLKSKLGKLLKRGN